MGGSAPGDFVNRRCRTSLGQYARMKHKSWYVFPKKSRLTRPSSVTMNTPSFAGTSFLAVGRCRCSSYY